MGWAGHRKPGAEGMAWEVHGVPSGLEWHVKWGSCLGVKESGMFLVQLD